MTIYVVLILYILGLAGIVSCLKINKEKKTNIFLMGSFLAIFLIYTLRDSSVGRDLPGYKEMYLESAKHAWFDFEYVYFENGYILLEKLCSSLKLSFQSFLTVINVIILLPIYRFIKKYSVSPFMSVMIYICYMFFEFNMTGIRQAIATSIVLVGYMFLLEQKKHPIIWYLFFVILASSFHTGAYAAMLIFPFLFLRNIKSISLFSLCSALLILVLRSKVLTIIKFITKKGSMDITADLYIGLNFITIILLAVLFVYGAFILSKKIKHSSSEGINLLQNSSFDMELYNMNNKLFLASILALLIFGSDTSARSYMILAQVMFVQLPNSIGVVFNKRSIIIVQIIIVVLLICFFIYNTLLANNFDIIPYKFYWQ